VDSDQKFTLIYALVAIILALTVLTYLAVRGQLYWSITLTFLTVACIVAEWQVIRLPQGDSLTLSIIFILLALVFRFQEPTSPMRQAVGALQVITVGSMIGYGLTHHPHPVIVGFYVAHHILSTALAGIVFVELSNRLPYVLLTSFHLIGIIGYVLVLALTSTLLVGPVNKRIVKGEKLPKAEIVYAVFLAPIALIVYYFFESRQLNIASLLLLALPLIGVLVTFRLYVNIDTTYGEINQLYRISQEFVAAMSQEETVQRIAESISQALRELIPRLDGCLIYAHSTDANEYILVNPDPNVEAPAIVIPGRGLLGRAATDATGMVVNEITLRDALSPEEREWPPKMAILAHPMLAEHQNAGILVLMRHGKGFTAEEFRLVSIVANQAGVALHNAQLYEQSRQMADIDRQLGILNQSAFTQQSQRALGRAQISRKPVAVLLGDIDDFRNVNNTYGHQTGDKVLAGIAQLMKNAVDSSGFVGRWGGEEFVITLPNTDEQQAMQIAQRIRKRVEEHEFVADDDRSVHATISIGVAVFPRDAGDFISLHKQADRAAYLAKKTGKNRVCLYEDRKHLIGPSTDEIAAPAVVQEHQK
jgi:diguanylate cyclase (GGDEF)-like protein